MTEFLVETYQEGSYRGTRYVAVVFDPEKKKYRSFVCSATYHSIRVELPRRASDEVKEMYLRVKRVRARWKQRAKDIETARRLRLDHYSEAKKLNLLTDSELEAVTALLKTEKIRSPFFLSLSEQVRRWLKDQNSPYKTPLSRKQFESLKGFTNHYGR